nr:BCCT family transporter [Desertibacillus haloalkaliphilus]
MEQTNQQGKPGIVFYTSVIIALLFVFWGVFFTDHLSNLTADALAFVLEVFGWFYVLIAVLFVIFIFYLAFSRFGKIRLGKDDDEPEFSKASWFAMLFSAGMGIGLVFWGVAEPTFHYLYAPFDIAPSESEESAKLAFRYTFFHWGLQPWAIYSLVALALAYFNFRKGEKGLISMIFKPLLGDRVYGPIGNIIDVIAIFATIFGVATTLGFGASQISGGLNYLFDIPNTTTTQISVIAIVTVLFMLSAYTGLKKGIKYLSNTNLVLAALLLLFTFLLGPTLFILNTFTQSIGDYLGNLVQMSFSLSAIDQHPWVQDWTIFYWAWWIAWAPFVGSFIARVSRGRTIREFVIGVLLVPTVTCFFWFSVFGGSAIHLDLFQGVDISTAVDTDMDTALFVTLDQFPISMVTSLIAILLVMTFFITSADSATFVLGMMSSDGSMEPGLRIKFTWGILQSAVAAILLLAGGLVALEQMLITSALPFAIIMVGICISLYKALSQEFTKEDKGGRRWKRERRIQS